MKGRKLFAIHSILGLITGALLLVISLSGCILLFAEEIDHSLNPPLLTVVAGEQKVSLDSIYRSAALRFPDSYIRFRHFPFNSTSSLELSIERDEKWTFAYYNPYTGEYLGDRNAREYFMGWMLGLHYGLLAGKTGELLVGLLSITLVLSLITGIYAYRKHLVKVLLFQIPFNFKNWRRASSSLHRIIGVWSLFFNLLFAVTGFWMMKYVFQPDTYNSEEKSKKSNYAFSIPLDSVKTIAEQRLKGFKVSSIYLPQTKEDGITVYGEVSNQGALYTEYANSVQLDSHTGQEISHYLVSEQSFGEKWDQIAYPLHAGLFGNIAVKIVYCLFGISPALLSMSGFLLWLRKKKRK